MRKLIPFCGLALCLSALSLLAADDTPKFPTPEKEHEWLKQFVGEWETDGEGTFGEQTMKCKGTMSSRMLGGFWVVSETKGEVMGQPMNALQTIGYDPKSKKYVGTWVDSVMNHMWHYTGTVDETGKKLTLEAEGPNFLEEGKTAKYRDVYEFKSKDHVVTTSLAQDKDGKWVTFMKGNARRAK